MSLDEEQEKLFNIGEDALKLKTIQCIAQSIQGRFSQQMDHENRVEIMPRISFCDKSLRMVISTKNRTDCHALVEKIRLGYERGQSINDSNHVSVRSPVAHIVDMIQGTETLYVMSLCDRELEVEHYTQLEIEMRNWGDFAIFKALYFCMFLETNSVEKMMILSILGYTAEIQCRYSEELKSMYQSVNGLDALAVAATVAPLEAEQEKIVDSNALVFAMRCERNNGHTIKDILLQQPEDVEGIYADATEQVALLYDRVFVHGQSLWSFYESYSNSVKANPYLLPPVRFHKILLLRKVINRLHTISHLHKTSEANVSLFNYKDWNAKNLYKLVKEKQTIADRQMMKFVRQMATNTYSRGVVAGRTVIEIE